MIDLQRSLEKEIVQMMHAGICCFCAGGARGFDMLAESTVLRIKQDYPQVRLEIIVPFRGQAKKLDKEGTGTVRFDLAEKQTESYAYRNCMIGDVCR